MVAVVVVVVVVVVAVVDFPVPHDARGWFP